MTIAIVGNSPCILNHEWGEEIDSHDIVVRFNNFVTDGYEKYTGSKTTDICVCTMKEKYKNLNKFLEISKEHRFYREDEIPFRNDILNQMTKGKLTEKDITQVDYQKYHIDLAKKIYKNANEEWGKKSKQPSSGMIMLQYMFDTYPDAQIDAYGFDFFKNKNKIHFYDYVTDVSCHNPDYEKMYFNDVLSKKVNLKK